jgi:hypothetical protein
VREFIQGMIEGELEAALSRPRYGRRAKPADKNAAGPGGILVSGTATDRGR